MTYHDRDLADAIAFTDAVPIAGTTAQPATSTGPIPGRTRPRLAPLKRLMAAIALTLMLSTMLLSVTASSASARPGSALGANGTVTSCFDTGGDANTYYVFGTYYTSCTYDDGSSWWTED